MKKEQMDHSKAKSAAYSVGVIHSHVNTITEFVALFYPAHTGLSRRISRLQDSATQNLDSISDTLQLYGGADRQNYHGARNNWQRVYPPILGTHAQIGGHIKWAIEELQQIFCMLSRCLPAKHRSLKATDRLIKTFGSVRVILDDIVWSEHKDKSREKIAHIYYGAL
jgi:hypothetical protein